MTSQGDLIWVHKSNSDFKGNNIKHFNYPKHLITDPRNFFPDQNCRTLLKDLLWENVDVL